jgi:DNA-binding XRE family transcriptional regulator
VTFLPGKVSARIRLPYGVLPGTRCQGGEQVYDGRPRGPDLQPFGRCPPRPLWGTLRVLREERGLASDEFARRVGFRPEAIIRIETGQRRTKPSSEQLRLFANVLASTPVIGSPQAPLTPAPAAQSAAAQTSGPEDTAPPKSAWE